MRKSVAQNERIGMVTLVGLMSGVCTLLGACASDEQAPTETDPGAIVSDGNVRLVRVKKATTSLPAETLKVEAVKESVGPNGERIKDFPVDTSVSLKGMSVPEIAAKLQKRVLRSDGYEYREASLPLALAEKVKADLEADAVPDRIEGHRPEGLPLSTVDLATATASTDRYILGSDNRVYGGGSRGYPNSTQLYLGNCSATMIGRYVAATAAHCVYNNGTWTTPSEIIAAADDGSNPRPYGTFYWDTIGVPNGWTGSQWDLDYAYIVFSSPVGDTIGWLGTGDNSSGTMEMVGYPGDKPSPQMWAKAGNVTSTSSGRRKHNLDIVGGDSGAGMYTQGTYYVAGIQSTENWHETCYCGWWCCSTDYWNEATRWTSTVHSFFASTGVWPN